MLEFAALGCCRGLWATRSWPQTRFKYTSLSFPDSPVLRFSFRSLPNSIQQSSTPLLAETHYKRLRGANGLAALRTLII